MKYKKLEIAIVYSITFIWIMNYFAVSSLSAGMGKDYSKYVHLAIDNWVAYAPFWAMFYLSWFLIFAVIFPMIYLIKTNADILQFRKITLTIFFIYFISYLIYFLFPVNALPLQEAASNFTCLKYCLIDDLLRQFVPPWNALPSMHVAISWLIVRVNQDLFVGSRYRYLVNFATLVWFISICISTVALKYHYLLDIISGIVLAELAFIFIYKKYGEIFFSYLQKKISEIKMFTLEIGILIFLLFITFAFGLVSVVLDS